MENKTGSADKKSMSFPKSIEEVFYESGLFSDIKNVAQAMVKVAAGKEMGLTPVQSMNSVYICRGKIAFETKVFLAKLKASQKYDYSVSFTKFPDGKTSGCSVKIYEINANNEKKEVGEATFTATDAMTMGKMYSDAYKNYRDLMFFYRAASKAMKMFCPDILGCAQCAEDFDLFFDSQPEKAQARTLNLNDLDKPDYPVCELDQAAANEDREGEGNGNKM
jgi:hypothetical protein